MRLHRKASGPSLLEDVITVEHVTAVLAAIAIGTRLNVGGPVNLTSFVPAILLPVWLHYVVPRHMRVIVILGLGAIANGLVLNSLMASSHTISGSLSRSGVFLLLEVVLGAGALIWARSVIGSAAMALSFGIGMFVALLTTGISSDNPWKFSFFVPVTICALAICWWLQSFRIELVVLAALAITSALNDSRSAASFVALTLVILVWQRIRTAIQAKSSSLRVITTLALIGSALYLAMQSFILDGYLGQDAQARSEAQIQTSGSLLVGGRPELGATVALLREQPWGYGVGVQPNTSDINVAKSGMMSLNYDPNNGYVEHYMFGNGFEVHSVIGDLWLRFGIVGLAFAGAAVFVVAKGAIDRLAMGCGRALTTFVAIRVTWDALFGPFFSGSGRLMMLGIALLAADVRLSSYERKQTHPLAEEGAIANVDAACLIEEHEGKQQPRTRPADGRMPPTSQ